jgi:hypothetical protein
MKAKVKAKAEVEIVKQGCHFYYIYKNILKNGDSILEG